MEGGVLDAPRADMESAPTSACFPKPVGAHSICARFFHTLEILPKGAVPAWIATSAAAGKNPRAAPIRRHRGAAWAAASGWKSRARPAGSPRRKKTALRPQQQINPQKAGYRPGAPKRQRRVTQAELIRQRNRRRALGILAVLAVLAVGAFVSLNLLFKVTIFRVENFDRTTPADTGIYTSDELISALNIEKNSNLFGFSTTEKTRELAQQFPYLEQVKVEIQMPATVVVKVEPAIERFACMYSGGWMVLSDSLKILRVEISQPDGLVQLELSLPTDFTPSSGRVSRPRAITRCWATSRPLPRRRACRRRPRRYWTSCATAW